MRMNPDTRLLDVAHIFNFLPAQTKQFLDAVFEQYPQPKPLVYTAYDGDNLRYIDWMCYVAYRLGYTPVNPEAALGSYLFSHYRQDAKTEILRDCIALELLCDEFWIFTTPDASRLSDLPEGVIAELMMWHQHDNQQAVRLWPWLEQMGFHQYAPLLQTGGQGRALLKRHSVPNHAQELFFKALSPTTREDIQQRVLTPVMQQGLRQRVFISQDFHHFKHIEWARVFAFARDAVPLCPDTLFNQFVSQSAYGEDYPLQHLRDRFSILQQAEELWLFVTPQALDGHQLLHLAHHQMLDMYYWYRHCSEKPVRLYTWLVADVPKYRENYGWALTRTEHRQNTYQS